MINSSLDRQFARFMKQHNGRCGVVTIDRPHQMSSGLTLSVSCSCGVKSEWEVIPPRAEARSNEYLERRTA